MHETGPDSLRNLIQDSALRKRSFPDNGLVCYQSFLYKLDVSVISESVDGAKVPGLEQGVLSGAK